MTRAVPLALLLCFALLTGCSTASNDVAFFADPAKYEFYNCKQLAAQERTVAAQHKQLGELIERAERGTAGVLVGVIAYRAEYRSTGEDVAIIQREQREKKCIKPPTWRSSTAIR